MVSIRNHSFLELLLWPRESTLNTTALFHLCRSLSKYGFSDTLTSCGGGSTARKLDLEMIYSFLAFEAKAWRRSGGEASLLAKQLI